jgi:hypothetical protein
MTKELDRPREHAPPNELQQFHNQQVLLEHFGYFPIYFVDQIIDTMNQIIQQSNQLLEKLTQSYSNHPEQHLFLFESLMNATVDAVWDKWEIYVMNAVFAIPAQVYIPFPHQQVSDPIAFVLAPSSSC